MTLRIAVGVYDRTVPLLLGRIGVEGHEARFETLPFEELFARAFDGVEFDVAELSFSNFLYLTSTGACPYVGLPVFPSRMFRHSAVFIRTDRGIRGPRDLVGRRVGVREFSMTAALSARGALEDEYGVPASAITWAMGRAEADDRPPVVRMSPRGIRVEPIPGDANLSDLLAAGEIDALVAYKPPSCFTKGTAPVARLFPDHEAVERDYFLRTGIFPVMHLVGIRRELAEAEPALCVALCDAFEAAKAAALHDFEGYQALASSHPWAPVEAARIRALMGDDPWSYGVAPNRAAIGAVARWSFAQGLADRLLEPEDLFARPTLDWTPR